jgi:hypothetical protein
MDDAQIVAAADLLGSPGMSPGARTGLIVEMRRINALSEEERQRELKRAIFRRLQIRSGLSRL